MQSTEAEIERLDREIRKHDQRGTETDALDAADLLWDKALLLEERDGPAAGIPLFREIVARVEGLRHPDAAAMWIAAMNGLAVGLHGEGRNEEARQVAGRVVHDHLHDGPLEVGVAMANAVIIWTRLEWADANRASVLPTLEACLARYAREPCPDTEWVFALMTLEIGKRTDELGDTDTAVLLYRRLVPAYLKATDTRMRDVIGETAMRLAYAIWSDEQDEAIDLCRTLVRDFDSPDLPDLAGRVEWAREALQRDDWHSGHRPMKRLGFLRRR